MHSFIAHIYSSVVVIICLYFLILNRWPAFWRLLMRLLMEEIPNYWHDFFLIHWSLWERWNKMIYEHTISIPNRVIEGVLVIMDNFKELPTLLLIPKNQCSCWKLPREGYLKLNVEETLFFDLNRTKVGSILKDCRGIAIMAANFLEQNIANPLDIEVLAILRGLQICFNQCISNLILKKWLQVGRERNITIRTSKLGYWESHFWY